MFILVRGKSPFAKRGIFLYLSSMKIEIERLDSDVFKAKYEDYVAFGHDYNEALTVLITKLIDRGIVNKAIRQQDLKINKLEIEVNQDIIIPHTELEA